MRWRTVRRVVAAPTHDPGRPTAVILLGSEGANAADVLAPYEVLAAAGAFNLHAVAPQRQPVPLTGNLDLVSDLSLGQLDQRPPTGAEVIVVPQLSEVASGRLTPRYLHDQPGFAFDIVRRRRSAPGGDHATTH